MGKMLPREVESKIDKMTEEYRQQLVKIWRWSNRQEEGEEPTVGEIEDRIREWIRQIGEDTQLLTLAGMDRYRRKGKRACPECGEEVYWERYEPRNYITTLAEIEIERAYYHHAACHCGWVPLDEELGMGASELSPRVQEMTSYLGAFMPFEKAQFFLDRYCNVKISHDTVNNSTVQIGQILQEQQQEAAHRVWDLYQMPACEVTDPPKRLYISADGINFPLSNGQGAEIKVAAVYETEERRNKEGDVEIHAVNIDYVVARTGEELARAVYVTAVKRGVESVEEVIVLGDGAKWIWKRIASLFPGQKTSEIVDFYHAGEYIWDAGKAVFGEESAETKEWGKKYCHILKHKGAAPVLQELRALLAEEHSTPEPLTRAITYFENQSVRMDYPLYVEQGLQIGSGSAESAVKQVVGARINQAGMRWNAERAEAIAHVRASILSDRWDDLWENFTPPPRQYQRQEIPVAA